ncbi:MAG: glycine cleavage system protein GcvH [Thermoplasmata archaeon]|nr:glycine cleavage system protein GcvH [Thermoplasmata archaeon]
MSTGEVPPELRYTKSHEWIRTEGEELVIGVTDHAQAELTDIVFVDLPKLGAELKEGATALVLESVKTVADVYAPAEGRVTAANETLKVHPELVNRSPYGDGWLFRLKRSAATGGTTTLTASEYQAFVASGGH